MENASERTQAAAPRGIEDLSVMVTVIHHVLAEQEIQMVMAIFMDQIIDQIEIVPVKAVDEGQTRPVPITETDDALGFKRDDPGGQQCQDFLSFWPGLLNGRPGPTDSRNLIS
jgi:hypothetical protein